MPDLGNPRFGTPRYTPPFPPYSSIWKSYFFCTEAYYYHIMSYDPMWPLTNLSTGMIFTGWQPMWENWKFPAESSYWPLQYGPLLLYHQPLLFSTFEMLLRCDPTWPDWKRLHLARDKRNCSILRKFGPRRIARRKKVTSAVKTRTTWTWPHVTSDS